MYRPTVCLTLCLVLLSGQETAAQQKKLEVTLKPNIVYGKGGDQKLMLDLAMPKDAEGPFPLVVCVHGGGWKAGNRQSMSTLINMLAQRGFVAATVTYRLAPKHKFPAQIEDCKAAVRFLRANAKDYKINPKKVGAVGFSAGGHLVSLMGAADKSAGLEGNGGHPEQSSRVQAVVNFFGPTDFINKTWDENVETTYLIGFLGGTFENTKEQYTKCSPLHYVSKDDPPFLFFHGDKDTLVKIHHSQIMTKHLKEAGVSAQLVTMKGAGHGWGGAMLARTLDQTIAFFEEKLKK